MIALDHLKSLEETLDIPRDPIALAQIRYAEAEESIPMTKAETQAWLAEQRADGAGD